MTKKSFQDILGFKFMEDGLHIWSPVVLVMRRLIEEAVKAVDLSKQYYAYFAKSKTPPDEVKALRTLVEKLTKALRDTMATDLGKAKLLEDEHAELAQKYANLEKELNELKTDYTRFENGHYQDCKRYEEQILALQAQVRAMKEDDSRPSKIREATLRWNERYTQHVYELGSRLQTVDKWWLQGEIERWVKSNPRP